MTPSQWGEQNVVLVDSVIEAPEKPIVFWIWGHCWVLLVTLLIANWYSTGRALEVCCEPKMVNWGLF